MNFDEMKNAEITKKLYELLGFKVITTNNILGALIEVDCDGDIDDVWVNCNSWSDMGPLIEQNFDYLFDLDEFGIARWDQCKSTYADITPLRAAAICLIKKLESES